MFRFDGRIRRSDFWLFTIVLSLAWVVVGVILLRVVEAVISGPAGFFLLMGPALLGFAWVTFALQVKRLHDCDKSAWWLVLGLLPLANVYVVFLVGFVEGTHGNNRYGRDPKSL